MELVIDGAQVRFQTQLPISEFPRFVEVHTEKVSRTFECEQLGEDVIRSGFDSVLLGDFISKVCQWGGWAGIAGNIRRQNSPELIRERFLRAHTIMCEPGRSISAALTELNFLKGLGTPSFASKHLRFLHPQFCPILDQVTARLGYTFTPKGYEAFAEDCAAIARELDSRGIYNPVPRPSGRWFCSEVDMALFAYLNGWQ